MQQTAQALSIAATIAAEKGKDVLHSVNNVNHNDHQSQQQQQQQQYHRYGGGAGGYGASTPYDNNDPLGGAYRPPSIVGSHDEEDGFGLGAYDEDHRLPFASPSHSHSPSQQAGHGLLRSSIFSHGTQQQQQHQQQQYPATAYRPIDSDHASPNHHHPSPSLLFANTNSPHPTSTAAGPGPAVAREDNNDFEVVAQFQRRFRLEGWGAVADLDAFFSVRYVLCI
jgi:hypothetical protein